MTTKNFYVVLFVAKIVFIFCYTYLQKMGIKAECDEIDEGVSSDENVGSIQDKTRQFRLRYKLKSVHSMNKSFSK